VVKNQKKMKKIVLVGAGGKMGMRLTHNLSKSEYSVKYLEVSEAGISQLHEKGITVSNSAESIPEADVVIYAVPDIALGNVTAEYIPMMKSGSMAVTLDPAAALAGKLHNRGDISYFIAHPAHPSIFYWGSSPEEQKDHFGGVAARQAIVCALMQGSEEDYSTGANLASTFYAPVFKAHRITVEQMGLLEPALVETLASTCIYLIRQGLEEIIKLGVPTDAARDFLLGHLRIQMAVLFDEIPGAVFSDAANKALQRGLKEFIKDDWRKVFEPENVKEQIRSIT
jgi:hypothetical protein